MLISLKTVVHVCCIVSFPFVLLAAESPVVLWTSNPVGPGETVVLYGGQWDETATVTLKDGSVIEPTLVSDANIMFVFPPDHPTALLEGVVTCKGAKSEPFTVNRPDVWWVQGDWGKEASPNGWMRVFGTAIAMNPEKTRLGLRPDGKNQKAVALKIEHADRWNIEAPIPPDFPEGRYDVILSDSVEHRTVGAITIRRHEDVWKKTVYNVADYGAVPNDGFDDTQAVQAALEEIKTQGGGILHFPRGRFQVRAMLEIPPRTLVRGEGRELTQLYWPDTYAPPEALLRGTHSFGVEDLTITSGYHRDGIVSNKPGDEEHGNVTIRRIRMRLIFTQYLYQTHDELARRAKPIHHVRALRVGGDCVRVYDNDIHSSGGGIFELSINDGFVRDNILSKNEIFGWNGFGGSQLIFERNRLKGPMCTSYYGRREGSTNIYWANNIHEQNFDGNNRETITGDGKFVTYLDTAKAWEDRAVLLKEPIDWQRGIDVWRNGCVQILNGRGTGQFRRIVGIEGNRLELDRPWDIKPDADSLITVASFRNRFLYVGNETADSTIALQFYGSMIEAVVAENKFARTGGVHSFARWNQPSWFIQYLDNTILEGNAYRTPGNRSPATDAYLAFTDNGMPGKAPYSQVRSCVMRGNVLESNAKLAALGPVDGALFERNTVKNADVGIEIEGRAKNILVRANRFERVLEPWLFRNRETVLAPAENIRERLRAAMLVLGDAAPASWKETLAKLDALNADERKNGKSGNGNDKETQDRALALLRESLVALERQTGENRVDARIVKLLLGLTIASPNWTTIRKVLDANEPAEGRLMLRTPEDALLPFKAEIAFDDRFSDRFPGWEFGKETFDQVPGKLCDRHWSVKKPAGTYPIPYFPLSVQINGDGWKLTTQIVLTDFWAQLCPNEFLLAGPVENEKHLLPSGVFELPEFKIDPADTKTWKPVRTENNRINLRTSLGMEKGDSVVYALTAVRAKRSLRVMIRYEPGCLLYLNGEPVGTALQNGQWGSVALQEGINRFLLVGIDRPNRPQWELASPRITMIDPIFPGDLELLTVEELSKPD